MPVDDDLRAFQAYLLGLGAAVEDVAREAAPKVEAELKRTAAAGTTPEGEAWQPTKDGRRALPKADEAITTEAKGGLVITTLTGVYTFHTNAKNDAYRRRILPDPNRPLPPSIVRVLREATLAVLGRRK